MEKKAFIGCMLIFFLSVHIQAESSLFGPSKSEVAYQKQSAKNREQITELIRRINVLNERVYGLTTVVEGQNAIINELRRAQSAPASNVGELSVLEMKIDRVRRECVTHQELDGLLAAQKGSAKKSTLSKKAGKSEKKNRDILLSGKTNSDLYNEGVRLFQKKKYNDARRRFTITQKKNYKPAASSYYLGEIAYYTQKYKDALFYFKKSAGLYDQASYIDTLLLHTAISLEKRGDKSQAKVFYQTIIDGYPEKKSAKIARKKLKKL